MDGRSDSERKAKHQPGGGGDGGGGGWTVWQGSQGSSGAPGLTLHTARLPANEMRRAEQRLSGRPRTRFAALLLF